MVGGAALPMIRFAVDPILQKKESGGFVRVIEESQVTNEPTEVKFKIHQVDGWYESEPTLSAWISKSDDGTIFALSPVCKHLGCMVAWGTEHGRNEYYCPCHGALYTKDGEALKVAPRPLDQYEVRTENGWVYLGPIIPNSRV